MPTHQEAANFFKPKKFLGEKKKKNKETKNSLVDKTKLNVSSFTSNSYPPNSFNVDKIKSSSYSYSHKINFLLDTGASCHFVNDASLFTNYQHNKSTIILADNSETISEG